MWPIAVAGAWQHLWAGVTVARLMTVVQRRRWMKPQSMHCTSSVFTLGFSSNSVFPCLHPFYISARSIMLWGCSASVHTGWWRGVVVSGVHRMNEVNPRRARLLPGWVTVFGQVYHVGK